MALWNRKRPKPRRVDRLHAEGDVPWHTRLRSRHVLWQLGLLAAVLVAMTLIIQMARPPLPYRKGEKTTHPILARVDFEYIDTEVTATVRELTALLNVPGLYTPDARQVLTLREGLLGLVDEIAKAATFDKLPEAVQKKWQVTPAMFDAAKKALGEGAVNLSAIHETLTKATAALADPLKLPVVREEDHQRASARIEDLRDLRSKLPAGLAPDTVPILKEPAARILVQLPEGDQEISLPSVITVTQTDRIKSRLQPLIGPALEPLFGAEGAAVLTTLVCPLVGPTLAFDQAKTENTRADVRSKVQPVPVLRKANTTLVEAGKEITDADVRILVQEQAARLKSLGWLRQMLAWVGLLAVLVVLVLIQAADTARFQPSAARSVPRSLMLAVLVLLVVGGSKAVAQAQWPVELYTPLVTTAALIVAIAYGDAYALAVGWLLVLLVALATRADLDWALTAAAGTGAAVLALGEINNRSKLIKVGALAGLVLFATRSGLALWRLDYADGTVLDQVTGIFWPSVLYFGVGLGSGIVLLAILPFIERLFGIVTNISLLELCDVNQPALKRLALEAPGTYAHSLLIGTLAEAAAEAIGANGLLARVGAYFHDIGKANKPRYFVENYGEGQPAHGGLAPQMSRLIIMSHVKDGQEMADRLGLPPVIRNFIAEHHGTTLMEYFYHEAKRQAAENGCDPPDESDYRYPGPKPRSPETAIVMLADAVEGATRSLKERTASRIGATVHDMAMKRLLDGQLDQSGLTLNDLQKVEETLTKTLLSVYHGRVRYPGQDEGGPAEEKPDAAERPAPPAPGAKPSANATERPTAEPEA